MRSPQTRRGRSAFTLIEILVATLLLGLSLIAIVKLWGVSRSITETSRNTAEYYTVARKEIESGKDSGGFNALFIPSPITLQPGYYDQTGTLLGRSDTPISGAYYKATSTFSLVATSGETDAKKKLGVHRVQIYVVNNGTVGGTVVFDTTMFYCAGGI